MAKQTAGPPLPDLPDVPRNAAGEADGNPSRASGPTFYRADGLPVSPGLGRDRAGAASVEHGQPYTDTGNI